MPTVSPHVSADVYSDNSSDSDIGSTFPSLSQSWTRVVSFADWTKVLETSSLSSLAARMTSRSSKSSTLMTIEATTSLLNASAGTSRDSSLDDVDSFLQRANDEFTHLVIPAIVYLAILGIVGVVGNCLVLYIYNRKLRKGTIRWFVQALAVFDLLSCLVAVPGEIIDMRNNYTFGLSPMCKVLRTVNMFCTVASGMTLLVVAVERYKRICTPLRKQISPTGAQVVITICTVAASVCAAPASFIYGRQTTPTDHPAINGSDCSTADTLIGSLLPLAFTSFQLLLFVGGAIALVVLYSLIGRKVLSHARFRRDGFGLSANRRMSYIFTGSECSSPTTEDMIFHFPTKRGRDSTDEASSGNNNDSSCCSGVDGADNNNVKKPSNKVAPLGGIRQSPPPYGDRPSTVCCSASEYPPTGSSASPPSSKSTEQSPVSAGSLGVCRSELVQTCQCGVADRELKFCSKDRPLGETQNAAHGGAKVSSLSETFASFCKNGIIPEHDVTGYNEVKSTKHVPLYEKPSSDASDENSEDYLDRQLPDTQVSGENLLSPSSSSSVVEADELSGCETVKNSSISSVAEQVQQVNDDHQQEATPADTVPAGSRPEDQAKLERQVHCDDLAICDKPCNDGSKVLPENAASDQPVSETPTVVEAPLPGVEVECRRFVRRVSRQRSSEPPTPTEDLPRAWDTPFRRSKTSQCGKVSLRDRNRSGDSTGSTLRGRYQRRTSNQRQWEPRRLKRQDSVRSGTRRTTLMLFLITLVYLLSFLPYLVLVIIKVLDRESLSGRGGGWEVAHNILLRSYFINSMANPIIYSFCSRTFRKETSRVLHCKCCMWPPFVK